MLALLNCSYQQVSCHNISGTLIPLDTEIYVCVCVCVCFCSMHCYIYIYIYIIGMITAGFNPGQHQLVRTLALPV